MLGRHAVCHWKPPVSTSAAARTQPLALKAPSHLARVNCRCASRRCVVGTASNGAAYACTANHPHASTPHCRLSPPWRAKTLGCNPPIVRVEGAHGWVSARRHNSHTGTTCATHRRKPLASTGPANAPVCNGCCKPLNCPTPPQLAADDGIGGGRRGNVVVVMGVPRRGAGGTRHRGTHRAPVWRLRRERAADGQQIDAEYTAAGGHRGSRPHATPMRCVGTHTSAHASQAGVR